MTFPIYIVFNAVTDQALAQFTLRCDAEGFAKHLSGLMQEPGHYDVKEKEIPANLMLDFYAAHR